MARVGAIAGAMPPFVELCAVFISESVLPPIG